jgi:3-polyprenyl-4-hydroxybenzoate decarboxylase
MKEPSPKKLKGGEEELLTLLEAQQLRQLEMMQFPRQSALRALRAAGDVDGAMMLLISEIEAMDEAKKEDEARMASEESKDLDKITQKKSKELSILDVKIPLLSGSFHCSESVLIPSRDQSSSDENKPSFRTVLKRIDKICVEISPVETTLIQQVRKLCVKLLDLENNAIKWYSTPAKKYVEHLSSRLLLVLTERGAFVATCEKATFLCIVREVMELEVTRFADELYAIPTDSSSSSRIPDCLVPFLQTTDEDDDDEIEVIAVKPPCGASSTQLPASSTTSQS